MHKGMIGVALAVAAFSAPTLSAAAPSTDSRVVAERPWDADRVTDQVVKTCNIPRIYVAVERDYDGYARVMASPSVTADQHVCIKNIIDSWGIPLRK